MKIKDYSDFIEDKESHYETDVFVCGYNTDNIEIKIIDGKELLVSYKFLSSSNYTKVISTYAYTMTIPIDSNVENINVVKVNGYSFYIHIPKKDKQIVELNFKL